VEPIKKSPVNVAGMSKVK